MLFGVPPPGWYSSRSPSGGGDGSVHRIRKRDLEFVRSGTQARTVTNGRSIWSGMHACTLSICPGRRRGLGVCRGCSLGRCGLGHGGSCGGPSDASDVRGPGSRWRRSTQLCKGRVSRIRRKGVGTSLPGRRDGWGRSVRASACLFLVYTDASVFDVGSPSAYGIGLAPELCFPS